MQDLKYFLVNKSSEISDRHFELVKGRNSIGRSSANSICLRHASVSRVHAVIVLSKSRLLVRDLGSRNGTFVRDERVTSKYLEPEINVRFGKLSFSISTLKPDDSISSRQETLPLKSAERPTLITACPSISEAEQKVFDILINGLSEREISGQLGLSRHTVHNHIRSIYRAYDVHSKAELMAKLLSLKSVGHRSK